MDTNYRKIYEEEMKLNQYRNGDSYELSKGYYCVMSEDHYYEIEEEVEIISNFIFNEIYDLHKNNREYADVESKYPYLKALKDQCKKNIDEFSQWAPILKAPRDEVLEYIYDICSDFLLGETELSILPNSLDALLDNI